MPTAYSVDLRVRILHDCHNGMNRKDAAQKYSVSLSCVSNFCQQYKDTNNIAPKEYKRGRKQKHVPYENEVRQLITDHPDASLVELCEKLSPHVSVCPAALCHFLHRLKITCPKNALSCRTTQTMAAKQNKE